MRLFQIRGAIPRIIVSVGSPERLAGVLAHLGEVLPDPVVTLEPVAEVKHDGEVREPFAVFDDADLWQTIESTHGSAARSTSSPGACGAPGRRASRPSSAIGASRATSGRTATSSAA